MRELVQQDFHLADLAMQFHAESAIDGEQMNYHQDGPNSSLHMAISLMGTRTVHTRTAEDGQESHKQTPGDVYIGNPFALTHAVEYPECRWEPHRIFCIQARFLFPSALSKSITAKLNKTDFPAMMNHVADVIRKADILMPSLDQVMEQYAK